ncbi:MAG: NAD-dependent epimerase/dehydratase family protein, partial [Deltaproteobacteria bacterium]|nr:NAD-dependent epimerase/dehydratase family protein [Deltaproteobacteria bacterium]
MSARRVLVTGGAGFIGSRLAAQLRDRGDEVVVLDDLSMGTRERVPEGVRLEVGDVRDAGAVAGALRGVHVVFHLAARVSIRKSVENFRDDHDVNLGGTLTLLEALEGTSVSRLVYASSMAVYADGAPGARLTEEHPTMPLGPYGVSKLAAEHYCRVVTQGLGVEQVSLRYFNTWGPGQTLTPYVGVAT